MIDSTIGNIHKYLGGHRGRLYQQGNVIKSWKPRFFVLERRKLKIYQDETLFRINGEFVINDDTMIYDVPDEIDGRKFLFYVCSKEGSTLDEVLYLSAQSRRDKSEWMEAIMDAVHNGLKLVNQPELWLDAFYPSVDLSVSYENSTVYVEYGNMLKPSMVEDPPNVTLRLADPSCTYSLIMVDLDSIHSNTESRTVFLHWAIVNIHGADITTGVEVAPYISPAPEFDSGLHRYFLLLFTQNFIFTSGQILEAVETFQQREQFSYLDWIRARNLGDPVGLNGFFAGWEEYCSVLHEKRDYHPSDTYLMSRQDAYLQKEAEAIWIEDAKLQLYYDLMLSDLFPPSVDVGTAAAGVGSVALKISYEGEVVGGGAVCSLHTTQTAPTVSFTPHQAEICGFVAGTNAIAVDYGLYALLMVDADANSNSSEQSVSSNNHNSSSNSMNDLRAQEGIHWAVLNIPQSNVHEGVAVVPYRPPTPSNNTSTSHHRFVFCLYKQKKAFTSQQIESSRTFFTKNAFMRSYEWVRSQSAVLLNIPVGLEAFLIQCEDSECKTGGQGSVQSAEVPIGSRRVSEDSRSRRSSISSAGTKGSVSSAGTRGSSVRKFSVDEIIHQQSSGEQYEDEESDGGEDSGSDADSLSNSAYVGETSLSREHTTDRRPQQVEPAPPSSRRLAVQSQPDQKSDTPSAEVHISTQEDNVSALIEPVAPSPASSLTSAAQATKPTLSTAAARNSVSTEVIVPAVHRLPIEGSSPIEPACTTESTDQQLDAHSIGSWSAHSNNSNKTHSVTSSHASSIPVRTSFGSILMEGNHCFFVPESASPIRFAGGKAISPVPAREVNADLLRHVRTEAEDITRHLQRKASSHLLEAPEILDEDYALITAEFHPASRAPSPVTTEQHSFSTPLPQVANTLSTTVPVIDPTQASLLLRTVEQASAPGSAPLPEPPSYPSGGDNQASEGNLSPPPPHPPSYSEHNNNNSSSNSDGNNNTEEKIDSSQDATTTAATVCEDIATVSSAKKARASDEVDWLRDQEAKEKREKKRAIQRQREAELERFEAARIQEEQKRRDTAQQEERRRLAKLQEVETDKIMEEKRRRAKSDAEKLRKQEEMLRAMQEHEQAEAERVLEQEASAEAERQRIIQEKEEEQRRMEARQQEEEYRRTVLRKQEEEAVEAERLRAQEERLAEERRRLKQQRADEEAEQARQAEAQRLDVQRRSKLQQLAEEEQYWKQDLDRQAVLRRQEEAEQQIRTHRSPSSPRHMQQPLVPAIKLRTSFGNIMMDSNQDSTAAGVGGAVDSRARRRSESSNEQHSSSDSNAESSNMHNEFENESVLSALSSGTSLASKMQRSVSFATVLSTSDESYWVHSSAAEGEGMSPKEVERAERRARKQREAEQVRYQEQAMLESLESDEMRQIRMQELEAERLRVEAADAKRRKQQLWEQHQREAERLQAERQAAAEAKEMELTIREQARIQQEIEEEQRMKQRALQRQQEEQATLHMYRREAEEAARRRQLQQREEAEARRLQEEREYEEQMRLLHQQLAEEHDADLPDNSWGGYDGEHDDIEHLSQQVSPVPTRTPSALLEENQLYFRDAHEEKVDTVSNHSSEARLPGAGNGRFSPAKLTPPPSAPSRVHTETLKPTTPRSLPSAPDSPSSTPNFTRDSSLSWSRDRSGSEASSKLSDATSRASRTSESVPRAPADASLAGVPRSPAVGRSKSNSSITSAAVGVGTTSNSISEGVAQAKNSKDLCRVFGVSTKSIFDGDKLKKKFSTDFLAKDSAVWIDPQKRSLHWGKRPLDAENSKFILLEAPTSAVPNLPAHQRPLGEAKGACRSAALVDASTFRLTLWSDRTFEAKLMGERVEEKATDWVTVINLFQRRP